VELPWTELERSAVAASLAEVTVPVAIAAMCDAMSTRGIPCALMDAGAATIVPAAETGDDGVQVAVRRPDEGGLAFLVLERSHGLTAKDLARVVRLFELVLGLAPPISPSVLSLHRLRNRLAGVLGNIEFVEMVIADAACPDVRPEAGQAEGWSPDSREEAGRPFIAQRQEILSALRHARRSCREVASALHPGEQKNTGGNDGA
jgi:hypothetical protein